MALGFLNGGFRPIFAADFWKPAVATYRANIGSHIAEQAIDERISLPDADVIAGGPPCQGFSSAGARRQGDMRNTLVGVFARLVAEHRPRAFVFENVEGFVTNDNGRFVFELLDPVIEAGYQVHLRKVNAANYGVPQHRKRILAIGGLGWAPTFPESTHSAWGAPGALFYDGLPRTPSLTEALAGLGTAVVGDDGSGLDHSYAPLSATDVERAIALAPGQRMRDLPEEMWHESYRRRAFRRVRDGTPSDRRGGAPAGVRRLHMDEPCKSITGGAQNELLHPTEDRPLTIRECARVQSFPDSFHFTGSRSERLQQIGNAVPPLLATAVALQLWADLQMNATVSGRRGTLLSFQPTPSAGMSPALQRVSSAVRGRYAQPEGGLFDVAV